VAEEPVAVASKTDVQVQTEKSVEKKFLKALIAKEDARSRLSRARLPPTARRIRATDQVAQKDDKGSEFVAFAIDNKWGYEFDEDEAPRQKKVAKNDPDAGWTKNVITGCYYPSSGEVFVKYGKDFRASEVLLGKKTPVAAAHVCKAGGETLAVKN
jgi:hypothetical protein